MTRLTIVLALGGLVAASAIAFAVVEAEMTLAQLVDDSQWIAVAKLSKLEGDAGKGVLTIDRVLKGSESPATVPLKLLAPAGGEGNPDDLQRRVEEGSRLVVFLSQLTPEEHQIFAYGNGSWFKLRGVGPLSGLKAVFLQGEPYLRRTYRGDEASLVELLSDALAGKGELPGIDQTEKPGLGPLLNDAQATSQGATTPEQIEFGPAWRDSAGSAAEIPSIARYAGSALVLLASIALVLMLTRSLPECAA